MKRVVQILALLAFIGWGPVQSLAYAENFATIAEAEAMLDRAAAYVAAHGTEDAAQVFMQEHGPFRDRDLYVSMFRADDGVRLANANPRLVGHSIATSIDADGYPYGKRVMDIVRSSGEGRVDYKILNPLTGTPMRKTSLIRRIGDVVLLVGAYR